MPAVADILLVVIESFMEIASLMKGLDYRVQNQFAQLASGQAEPMKLSKSRSFYEP
jgi:hypothetical protein